MCTENIQLHKTALISAVGAVNHDSVDDAKPNLIMTPHSMLTSDNAFSTALALILSMDSALISIVVLSLQVSLMAVFVASLLALPLGAALALWRFQGVTW